VPVTTARLPADLQGTVAANATPPPAATADNAASTPARASRNPAPSQPAADQSQAAKGERYLYGNGVPQNCALARKNLALAAERKNARALSLMGGMYATGHCAPRDLPTAYGWFAQALRVDPANHRVEDELSLIWKQMTPSEKQIALKK
jgi:TPR repeat protein